MVGIYTSKTENQQRNPVWIEYRQTQFLTLTGNVWAPLPYSIILAKAWSCLYKENIQQQESWVTTSKSIWLSTVGAQMCVWITSTMDCMRLFCMNSIKSYFPCRPGHWRVLLKGYLFERFTRLILFQWWSDIQQSLLDDLDDPKTLESLILQMHHSTRRTSAPRENFRRLFSWHICTIVLTFCRPQMLAPIFWKCTQMDPQRLFNTHYQLYIVSSMTVVAMQPRIPTCPFWTRWTWICFLPYVHANREDSNMATYK